MQGFTYTMDAGLAFELSKMNLTQKFKMEDVSLGGWIQQSGLDVAFVDNSDIRHEGPCRPQNIASHRIMPGDMYCLHSVANSAGKCNCSFIDNP